MLWQTAEPRQACGNRACLAQASSAEKRFRQSRFQSVVVSISASSLGPARNCFVAQAARVCVCARGCERTPLPPDGGAILALRGLSAGGRAAPSAPFCCSNWTKTWLACLFLIVGCVKMIMLSPLVQAPRPWWPRKVSPFPSCPSASTAPEHEELCSGCVFIALPQVCMQTCGRAGVLHASFVIFLLFVVILSSSQAVVVAGLQRAEPQNDGRHLTLCILQVLGRAQNVNLLLNLVISVCKKNN